MSSFIDAKFRPAMPLDLHQASSEELCKENDRCKHFTNKAYNAEVAGHKSLIFTLRRQILDAESGISELHSMHKRSLSNISLIAEILPKRITAELTKSKKARIEKRLANIDDTEEALERKLAELRAKKKLLIESSNVKT